MSKPQRPLMREISVNGQIIPTADIAAEAQNHPAPSGKPGFAWRAAARALVVRRLLLDQAQQQGLEPDPLELSKDRWETDDEALIRVVVENGVEPAEVTDKDCLAFFEAPANNFNAPNLYQPQHILIAALPEDSDARKAARTTAEALFETLGNNPDRLGEAARATSDCPSKTEGGFLGQISPGDTVPEFDAALKSTPAGSFYPGVLETRYGFHIIFMRDRVDGAALPYLAVADRIREHLEKRAWVKASKSYVSSLIEAADVTGLETT